MAAEQASICESAVEIVAENSPATIRPTTTAGSSSSDR
ncbi:hypothetical protein RINTHM_9550 [Richelia intracellularis HM01]|nr:hypothetical protein RINTHM_9550 [Richelia intracellularis HM01]